MLGYEINFGYWRSSYVIPLDDIQFIFGLQKVLYFDGTFTITSSTIKAKINNIMKLAKVESFSTDIAIFTLFSLSSQKSFTPNKMVSALLFKTHKILHHSNADKIIQITKKLTPFIFFKRVGKQC